MDIFKYKYVDGNIFELYKPGEVVAAMTCLLETLHFCLNPSKFKSSVDSSCFSSCLIHRTCMVPLHNLDTNSLVSPNTFILNLNASKIVGKIQEIEGANPKGKVD